MALDPNLPKPNKNVVVIKALKLTQNRHVKCLSTAMPPKLDKGMKGRTYKVVANKHVFVSLHWYDKSKFDLELRVDTVIWGEHFKTV